MPRLIYAKNLTASGIEIGDLSGLYIDPYDTVEISLFFSIDEIDQSEDLTDAIADSLIVLNDGERDLSLEESYDISTVPTVYDVPYTFTDLVDTPATYSGYEGLGLKVSPTGSGVEYTTLATPRDYFIELLDTPATYSGYKGQGLKVNPAGTGLQFATLADPIPNTFVGLLDTPTTYSGADKFLRIKSGEDGLEFTSIDLFEFEHAPPTFSGHGLQFLRVNEDEDGWDYVDLINTLTWAGHPTYDGDIYILGWHEKVDNTPPNSPDDPFNLSSGEMVMSPKKAFHTHIVPNILTISGTLPFTLTISGTVVDEAAGTHSQQFENITVTGTGYYQSAKSFVDEPQFRIVESSKGCTFDIYRSTYWDAANQNFIVRGCRLEWTPDQPNWLMDIHIYYHYADGSLHLIDEIHFDENDTYIRADDGESGKYKRTDYYYPIHGADSEGIIITMDQRAIGHYYFELKYSLDTYY